MKQCINTLNILYGQHQSKGHGIYIIMYQSFFIVHTCPSLWPSVSWPQWVLVHTNPANIKSIDVLPIYGLAHELFSFTYPGSLHMLNWHSKCSCQCEVLHFISFPEIKISWVSYAQCHWVPAAQGQTYYINRAHYISWMQMTWQKTRASALASLILTNIYSIQLCTPKLVCEGE